MELPKGIEEILNKQFKIIGENITFDDIPESGVFIEGKKEINWFERYKFSSYEQYLKWRKEAEPIIISKGHKFDEVDMLYGLNYKYIKTGDQVSLF